MTEEEKKAIEDLKEEIEYYKRKYFNSKDDEEYNDKTLYAIRISVKDSETLLNFIEKLQKENEKLREYYEKLLAGYNKIVKEKIELEEIQEEYFIPKSKIREKIKELKLIDEYDAPNGWESERIYAEELLQELLEEE